MIAINFTNSSSTIDSDGVSARNLTITSGSGGITLMGNLGSDLSGTLGSLTLNTTGNISLAGNINTTNSLVFNGSITLLNNIVMSSSNNATFNSSINGHYALTVNALSGSVSLNSLVGNLDPLSSLTINSHAINLNGGSVITMGSQFYTGTVALGANTSLSASNVNSAISFTNSSSTVDNNAATAYDLTINAGTSGITLMGNVGSGVNGALNSLTLNTTGTITLGGNVNTLASQSYNSPVVLASNVVMSTANNATFNSNINGHYALTINALNGTVAINGLVGNTNPLVSLIINSHEIDMNTGSLITTGSQSYTGETILGANTTLTATDANSAIYLASTIDNSSAIARSLTINSGTGGITLMGNVGSGANGALNSLTLNTTGNLTLGGNVNTLASQTYNSPVTLAGDVVMSTANNVTFNSSINGHYALTINALSGGVSLNSAVGNLDPLSSLTISGHTINLSGGSVVTTGSQSYTGAVVLGTNASLTTVNSDITFAGSINGAYRLMADAGTASVNINGMVGDQAALSSLSITSAANLNGGTVITVGNQNYTSLSLGADTSLTSSAGYIVATGSVTTNGYDYSTHDLTPLPTPPSAPPVDNVPPASEITPPVSDVPPANNDTTPPVVDNTPPADNSTPPVVDNTPPADNSTPPASDNTPPADNSTPPASDNTPPADNSTPPASDNTPPADNSTPPVSDNNSSTPPVIQQPLPIAIVDVHPTVSAPQPAPAKSKVKAKAPPKPKPVPKPKPKPKPKPVPKKPTPVKWHRR